LLIELFLFGVHQDPTLLMRALRVTAPPPLVLPVRMEYVNHTVLALR
jgi:hypothetical protein